MKLKTNNNIFYSFVFLTFALIGLSVISSTDTVDASVTEISLRDGFVGLEGYTIELEWNPEGYEKYQYAALVIAPDINNSDTWNIRYQDLSFLREGKFVLSSDIILNDKVNIGWVPVGENGFDESSISWSDPVFKTDEGISLQANLLETSSIVAASAAFQTTDNRRCHLHDESSLETSCNYNTNFWAGAVGNDIGGLVGYSNGNSLNLWGSSQFVGAYTQVVPSEQTQVSQYNPRNPYGFGFCVNEDASASAGVTTRIQKADLAWWDDSTYPGSPVSREGAASWIIAHFGNPDLWAIDPDWGMQVTNFQESSSPGEYPEINDGLIWNGIEYRPEDRLAAVHTAVRDLLTSGYSFTVTNSESVAVVQLAQELLKMSAGTISLPNTNNNYSPPANYNFQGVSVSSIEIEVDDSVYDNGVNIVTGEVFFKVTGITQTLTNSNGTITNGGIRVPLEGVPVYITSLRNGANFSGDSNTSGSSSSTHPEDLYDYTNSLGKKYTDENGLVSFTSNVDLSGRMRLNVAAEYPLSDTQLWFGGTGRQGNSTTAGVTRDTTSWSLTDSCEGACRPIVLVEKTNTLGVALADAEFEITKWNEYDDIRFASLAVLGSIPNVTRINNWYSQYENNPDGTGTLSILELMEKMDDINLYASRGYDAMSDADYVDAKYLAVLKRSPSAVERNAEITYIANNGRRAFDKILFESTEFRDQVAPENYRFSELVTTGTTNNAGRLSVNVNSGIYSANEIEAPEGYEIPEDARDGGIVLDGTETVSSVNAANAEIVVRTINAYTNEPIPNQSVRHEEIVIGNTNTQGSLIVPDELVNPAGGNITLTVGQNQDYVLYYTPERTLTRAYAAGETTYIDFYYYPKPEITTEASTHFIKDETGTGTVFDTITITNLAQTSAITGEGQTIDLTIELYGPYPSNTSLTRNASFLHSSQTIENVTSSSGNTAIIDSQIFTVTQPGLYTFWVEGEVEDTIVDQLDGNGNFLIGTQPDLITHNFGIAEETFSFTSGRNVTTEAWDDSTGQIFAAVGNNDVILNDKIFIDDLYGPIPPVYSTFQHSFGQLLDPGYRGEPAEIEVILHGPYETYESLQNADPAPTETQTFFVHGTDDPVDEYISPDFLVNETGWYVFEVNIYVVEPSPEFLPLLPFNFSGDDFFDYDLDNINFNAQYSHENYRNDDKEIVFVQEEITIRALKLGETSDINGNNTYEPLANVVLDVLYKEIDENGIETLLPVLDENDQPIQVTTDVNGEVEVNVPGGYQYCFQEVAPPIGYILNNVERCTNGVVTESVDITSPVIIYNDREDLPPTGFNIKTFNYLIMLFGFTGVILMVLGIFRKDEKII